MRAVLLVVLAIPMLAADPPVILVTGGQVRGVALEKGGAAFKGIPFAQAPVAELRWRGFSLEHSPDGRQPLTYDYKQISFTSPWKVMTGRYTREGDVRELLLTSDDMFVISRPGDEVSLSFAADKLPPLPKGWKRTFLLYADGFSKEMDINSASPDQTGPLPFHGMSKYPYAWPEQYPLTEKRRRYLETYNTRIVTSQVDRIAGFSGLAR